MADLMDTILDASPETLQELHNRACLLIDAKNGFNELNRRAMLWTVRHLWPQGSCFAFNCYSHAAQLLIRQPGQDASVLLSQEGVTQGDPLSMVLYGLALTPLAQRLRHDFPTLSQSWYADDASVIGDVSLFPAYFDALSKLGPPRGYYPQPPKSIVLPHPQADQAHIQAATQDLQCQFRLGHTYLGGFLGDEALRNQWIRTKIDKWISSVSKLAKAAHKFPHAAYAALTKNKQAEWNYVQRIVPNTAELFMPLLDEIRQAFLPAIAPNVDDRTLPPWLQHLPVRHGGLGLPNPTMGATHRTSSRDATTVLRASLLGQFPLAIEEYLEQARRSKWITKLERDADHLKGFKEKTKNFSEDHLRKIVRARTTGKWLTLLPSTFDNTDLSAEEF